ITKCSVAAELLACCIYKAHSSLGRRYSSHCFLVRFPPTSAAHKRRRSFVAYPRPGQVNLPGTRASVLRPSPCVGAEKPVHAVGLSASLSTPSASLWGARRTAGFRGGGLPQAPDRAGEVELAGLRLRHH